MLKPLHAYFVIEVESSTESAGGFKSPNARPTAVAHVVTIPDGEEDIKPGDRIGINHYSPLTIKIDGEEVEIISKEDIYGIVI